MKIALIIEGETERVFLIHLRRFLESRLSGRMPKIVPFTYDGRIPTGDKLKRIVKRKLDDSDAVIALTDVYTGTGDFIDGNDAKNKMREWVGHNDRFYPHAAQYEFEAWLLPYWSTIQKLAGHNRTPPPGKPEDVNHLNPPSTHIKDIFRTGKKRGYSKPIIASKILRDPDNDLLIAANDCPELKAFLNTILTLCEGSTIP